MHNHTIPNTFYNLFSYCRCIATYLKSLGKKIIVLGRPSLLKVETLDLLLKQSKNPLGYKTNSIKNSFKLFKIHLKGFQANLGQNETQNSLSGGIGVIWPKLTWCWVRTRGVLGTHRPQAVHLARSRAQAALLARALRAHNAHVRGLCPNCTNLCNFNTKTIFEALFSILHFKTHQTSIKPTKSQKFPHLDL